MRPGRVEDARLLTGAGTYLADTIPGEALHAVVLRADRAGARLVAVDAGDAAGMPGVRLVLTGADGLPDLAQDPLPRDDGGAAFDRPLPLLARDRLRHVGEPVALVVADTRARALDAAEAIGVETADDPEPPQIAFVRQAGDPAAVAAALAGAAHVVTSTLTIPRLHAFPLEPRACWAAPDGDGLHLRSSTQNPFALRKPLAALLGLDPARVRVSAGDVGGSFGLKGFLTREEALVALAALRLGAPVAWVGTRSEGLVSDHQGRGLRARVTLGFDADHRITALDAAFDTDAGAYVGQRSLGIINNLAGVAGVYAIPAAAARVTGRTSPRAPIAPFRGHGRPEATAALELTLDAAARALGVEAADLRRRNLIPAAALPCRNALGFPLDCGDFAGVLDRALALSDAAGAPVRAARAAAAGRLWGRGLILCVEAAGGPVRAPRPDHARLVLAADGTLVLSPGVMSVGQGHETVLTRLAADRLGLDAAAIAYAPGDTARLAEGRGNGGSSGLAVCGPAVAAVADAMADALRGAAAAVWGCPPADVTLQDGIARQAGTNRTLTLAEIAARSGTLDLTRSFTPPAATFPNGAHACEVEVDPETGAVTVLSYTAVEDVGTVLAPQLVEGQMMGGIAQGLAQALCEVMVHDEAGQVLTGTPMDYAVPRAGDLPPPRLAHHPVPTALNPLGVKGVGEAGTVGALAAGMAALRDALARAGVAEFQMPATPARVWAALQAAR